MELKISKKSEVHFPHEERFELLTIISQRLVEQLGVLSSLATSREEEKDESKNSTPLITSAFCKEKILRVLFLQELERQYPGEAFAWRHGVVLFKGKALYSDHYWLSGNSVIIDPWGRGVSLVSELSPEVQRTPFGHLYEGKEVPQETLTQEELQVSDQLKRRLRSLQAKWWYRRALHTSNVYLVGGALTGKRVGMEYLRRTLGLTSLDTSLLFRIVTHRLLHQDTLYPLAPDFSLLRNPQEREKEVSRIKSALSKRFGYIRRSLSELDSTSIVRKTGQLPQGTLFEQYYSSEVNDLVSVVAEVPAIRSLIKEWVEGFLLTSSGKVVAGYSYRDVDPSGFVTVHLTVDESVAVERLLRKGPPLSSEDALKIVQRRNIKDQVAQTTLLTQSLNRAIVVDTSKGSDQQMGRKILRKLISLTQQQIKERREQERHQISRESFQWPGNPLIEKLRDEGEEIIQEVAKDYVPLGISPMDLSVQTAIHMAAYPAAVVWGGDCQHPSELCGERKSENTLSSHEYKLNTSLFREVAKRQAERLVALHASLARDCSFDLLQLIRRMGVGPDAATTVRGKLSIDNKRVESDEGILYWTGEDKETGTKIIFKPVPPKISRIYMKAFHYLHEGREDEIAAFGAYLEGDEFPFALASYSPINRKYKRAMLHSLGVEPAGCVEFTRGWNAPWAPENTLSCLFAYSHERLKEQFDLQLSRYETATTLRGILTAINPNLGFKAHAFRGVHYVPVGLKPATFTYLKDNEGNCTYLPRREIQRQLGLPEKGNLGTHPRFQVSSLPMAPTVEMLVLMNKADQEAVLKKPIYVVSTGEY